MTIPQNILIVSAVHFEAEPTLEQFRKRGISFEYFEAGVGPIHAARSAGELCKRASGRHVLILGTSGSFTEFTAPYLVQIDKVFWLPTAERMGIAKYLPKIHPPVDLPKTGNFDLPYRQILCSTSISLHPDIGIFTDEIDLPPSEFLIENMEAYPLVYELLPVVKSLDVIMGITNEVGPHGSIQWQQNFRLLAKLTAEYLETQH